jgi:hypothetical protein
MSDSTEQVIQLKGRLQLSSNSTRQNTSQNTSVHNSSYNSSCNCSSNSKKLHCPCDNLCSTLTSADAIDTIKIPGSGLLNIASNYLPSNSNSNVEPDDLKYIGLNSNSNLYMPPEASTNLISNVYGVVYNSDPLQVQNPLGSIVTSNIAISNFDAFNVYNSTNYINGDLYIIINDPISPSAPTVATDIFPCLIGVNGSIVIAGTSLTGITGFYKLKYITGQLIIVDNDYLVNIPCFNELEVIDPVAPYNTSLPDLVPSSIPFQFLDNQETSPSPTLNKSGLSKLSKLSKSKLSNASDPNASQELINPIGTCGFANPTINYDNAGLFILGNSVLRTITGFEKLKYVNDITISGNNALISICGFASIKSPGSIGISYNNNLSLIKGFNSLNNMSGNLIITANNGYVSSAPISIQSSINIFDPNNYSTGTSILVIDAFERLTNVNDVLISLNHNLKVFSLCNLRNAYRVFITSNDLLTTLNFDSLRIAKFISIALNPRLINLAMSSLERVECDFEISENYALVCLPHFECLTYVAGAIRIINNISLQQIHSFKNLKSVGTSGYYNLYYVTDADFQYQTNTGNVSGEIQVGYDTTVLFNTSSTTTGLLPNVVSTYTGFFIANPLDILNDPGVILPHSIIIALNYQINDISAFGVEVIPDSVFILANTSLTAIKGFNDTEFILDFIVIANPNLKSFVVLKELCYARYIILINTMCIDKFCALGKLCQVNTLYIDAATPDTISDLSIPLPAVEAILRYYSLGGNCNPCCLAGCVNPAYNVGACGQCNNCGPSQMGCGCNSNNNDNKYVTKRCCNTCSTPSSCCPPESSTCISSPSSFSCKKPPRPCNKECDKKKPCKTKHHSGCKCKSCA